MWHFGLKNGLEIRFRHSVPDDTWWQNSRRTDSAKWNGAQRPELVCFLLFLFNASLVSLHGPLDQRTKVQELWAENNISVQEKCIHYIVDILINEYSRNLDQRIAFIFSVHSWRTAHLVSVYTLTLTELQSDFSCTIHVRLHFLYLIIGRALLRKILHNHIFILCIIFRQQK